MTTRNTQAFLNYPLVTFKKGQSILLKEDRPQAVYIIEKGKVSSCIITANGAELQVAIHGEGEDIPVGWAFGINEQSDFFYQAYSDCSVRAVPKNDYVKILRNNASETFEYLTRMNKQLVVSMSRISALEQPKAGDKVAFMLLSLAGQFGTRLRPYRERLRLAITQQEMADALGLTRETTGIELRKLELRNLITHSRKNYVLYTERLRKYIGRL